jgi:hypothetical protein
MKACAFTLALVAFAVALCFSSVCSEADAGQPFRPGCDSPPRLAFTSALRLPGAAPVDPNSRAGSYGQSAGGKLLRGVGDIIDRGLPLQPLRQLHEAVLQRHRW